MYYGIWSELGAISRGSGQCWATKAMAPLGHSGTTYLGGSLMVRREPTKCYLDGLEKSTYILMRRQVQNEEVGITGTCRCIPFPHQANPLAFTVGMSMYSVMYSSLLPWVLSPSTMFRKTKQVAASSAS